MSRRDQLLAKAAGIRSVSEISVDEVVATDHVPRSGQGSYARRQALEERIAALEKFGGEVVAIEAIAPNPWQPRRIFNEAEIRKLASSIAEVGLIQPIVVRRVRIPDSSVSDSTSVRIPDTFQLVAGERRVRAFRMLARPEINAIVVDVSDEEMGALALAENFDREDLTAYEIALAIKTAEAAFPNRKTLAAAMGINRTELYQYLAFFKLPEFVLKDLDTVPNLVGRDAAEDIAAVLTKHGLVAEESLKVLWTRVKSSDLDQGKIAATIEAAILRGDAPKTDRDIRKLFVGKEQAGSITRDANHLAIKIKVTALTPEKETELRAFVERMLG